MNNAYFDDLAIFIEVAHRSGFRSAATNLRMSPGAVSQAIQRLESTLQTRLIERTTRKIALTSAGKTLFERASPALRALESAVDDISDDGQEVSGVLKLSAPRDSALFFLDALLEKYSRTYPKVGIQIMYQNNKVDLVTSGVDAVIRSQTLLDNDTHAIEIGPELEMALVVSPEYIRTHGAPTIPSELTGHDGIRFAFGHPDKLAPWEFIDTDKQVYSVNPQTRFVTNRLASLANFALAGGGFAYLYKRPVRKFIGQGRLISLFETQMPTVSKYTINYLTKRLMPRRLRTFIDFAKQQERQDQLQSRY